MDEQPDAQGRALTPFWQEAFDPVARPFGSYRPSQAFSTLTRLAQGKGQWPFAPMVKGLQASLIKSPKLLIDTSHMGLNLRLSPAYYSQERALLKTGHHPEEASYAFVEDCRDKDLVFVDIGANTGLYSLMAAKLASADSRVLAIEPDASSFHKLTFQIVTNGFEDRIEAMRCAVGGAKGELRLHVHVGHDLGQNSLLQPATDQPASSSSKVSVETLADIVQSRGISQIDYLKIDVEGFEHQVLNAFFAEAPKILWPRNVLIEVKRNEIWDQDIVAEMLASGYEVKHELGDNSWLSFRE